MKVVVNIITFIRLIGAILLIPIFLNYDYMFSGVYLMLIFFTDKIDGMIARRFNCSTFFGSLFDTLCDKTLNIIAIILLAIKNPLFYICIALEVLIIIVNFLKYEHGKNIKSSQIGRIKMFVLTVCVIMAYLFIDNSDIVAICAISIIVIQAITLLTYIIFAFLLKGKKVDKKKQKIVTIKELLYRLFNTEFYLENRDKEIRNLFYK